MAERKPAPDGSSDPRDCAAPAVAGLGRREREVLAVLRSIGSASVQQVAGRLSSPLAYTTVMTTLDRLYRKGLLRREKRQRAFVYSSALTARDVEERRAQHLIQRFFTESDVQEEVLVSCLIDAVHGYDSDLLDRLEATIRARRDEEKR